MKRVSVRSCAVVLLAALGAGCSSKEEAGGPSVDVLAFSVTPTTVGIDETFTVSWDLERSGKAGYATLFGLYVGGRDTLSSDEAEQDRKIFRRGAGGATMALRDTGTQDCIHHGGTNVDCGPASESPSEPLAGVTRLTLLACEGSVLPPFDEVCDSLETDVDFATAP